MPDLYLVVDIIVVVMLTLLAATVLLKNSAVSLNRTFAYFVGCINVWIIANYISNDINLPPHTAVVANYFVFSFSFGACVFLLQFVSRVANDKKLQRILRYATVPFVAVAAMSATSLVVKNVELQGKVYAVIFGPLAPVYFSVLLLVIIYSVYVIKRNIKRAANDVSRQARLRVLFRSLCWTFPVLVLAQAILPATTGWFGLTNFGVLPMLILVYGLYYSVVKHKLFDLRLIIVRTIAYAITLGLLAATYGVGSYYVKTLVDRLHSDSLSGVLNVLLIIIMMLSYAPTKRLFDRITNRFFYQDAYTPQDLFDEYNKALVSTIDLNLLLKRTSKVIAEFLKAEYSGVVIKDNSEYRYRVVGTSTKHFDRQDIVAAHGSADGIRQAVIMSDELEPSDIKLRDAMQKYDIAAIVRLSAGSSNNKGGMGYIILGSKKSGNSYTRQDAKVLETLAKELYIALQNALRFEEIERFNETLQQKVTDATRQLRRTNDKLKQLNETKDDFIGMASHQLRTPLTSVKGYLSLVLDGDAGKVTSQQKQLLGQAFVSSQRMVSLISDLLNVSRLRTGKFVIEPTPTNIAHMISDEIGQLREMASSRNLELVYTPPADFPVLPLDETKTRQVIMNFIDNAIYYTPSGGRITIEVADLPKSVELRVIDNGIGVPPAERHHLFTKFYRAKNAQRARPDGTGLGLFMAKKVIVAQGGAIIFESTEGQGSTFGFSFPKDLAPAKPPQEAKH